MSVRVAVSLCNSLTDAVLLRGFVPTVLVRLAVDDVDLMSDTVDEPVGNGFDVDGVVVTVAVRVFDKTSELDRVDDGAGRDRVPVAVAVSVGLWEGLSRVCDSVRVCLSVDEGVLVRVRNLVLSVLDGLRVVVPLALRDGVRVFVLLSEGVTVARSDKV